MKEVEGRWPSFALGFLALLGACGDPSLPARPLERICFPDAEAPFPTDLADTGCFDADGRPGADLIPYEVASPLWSDGAHKRRWVVVDADRRLGPDLDLPVGSVLLKEFAMKTPSGMRRLETRVMLRRGTGWDFATYRWENGNAQLLGAEGLTETLEIRVDGENRSLEYTYPDRASCRSCHGAEAETLGFVAAQLDRSSRYGPQLDAFRSIGLVDVVDDHEPLPDPTDPSVPLDRRVRSYLHANCSHCHRPGGFAPVEAGMDMRWTTPLADMGLCDEPMLFWHFAGMPRLAPGVPERSGLFLRFTDASLPMPPIGTRIPNPAAVSLLREWIGSLDGC